MMSFLLGVAITCIIVNYVFTYYHIRRLENRIKELEEQLK